MGNKITRVVVGGSQADINFPVPPIAPFSCPFFNLSLENHFDIHHWYITIFLSREIFPFNSVFSWNYELCPAQEVDAHLRLYMVTPEVQVWGYLCSSQLNFPAFYAKRDFLRGENSLFTSSALPSLKQFWTGENPNTLYLCFFCVIY